LIIGLIKKKKKRRSFRGEWRLHRRTPTGPAPRRRLGKKVLQRQDVGCESDERTGDSDEELRPRFPAGRENLNEKTWVASAGARQMVILQERKGGLD